MAPNYGSTQFMNAGLWIEKIVDLDGLGGPVLQKIDGQFAGPVIHDLDRKLIGSKNVEPVRRPLGSVH